MIELSIPDKYIISGGSQVKPQEPPPIKPKPKSTEELPKCCIARSQDSLRDDDRVESCCLDEILHKRQAYESGESSASPRCSYESKPDCLFWFGFTILLVSGIGATVVGTYFYIKKKFPNQ